MNSFLRALFYLTLSVVSPNISYGDDSAAPTQTLTVKPLVYTGDARLMAGTLTPKKARALLQPYCNKPATDVDPCDLDDVHTYGLINVLVWDNGSTTKVTSSWFVYHPKLDIVHKWTQADLNARNRFYGAHTVALVMIQINAPANNIPIIYTINEKKRIIENIQSLQSLISLVNFGSKTSGSGLLPTDGCTSDGCNVIGNAMLDLTFPAADVTITSAIGSTSSKDAPKPPVQAGNPAASVPVLAPTNPNSLAPSGHPLPATPVPAPAVPNNPAPDGQSAAEMLHTDSPAAPKTDPLASVTLPSFTAINEAQQWWDISIAIPVKKVSELQLDSVNNTVAPTNINRQNAFAVIDLYPVKRDLVGAAPSLVPHPLIGVSLASQPLHTILAALGMGFSYGEVYVGAILQKSQDVTGLTAGSTATEAQLAAATTYSYKPQFSVGVNISIKGAVGALKK